MKPLKRILIFLILLFFVVSCTEYYTPKPRGYFRIDFPEKEYKIIDSLQYFSFELPRYSKLEPYVGREKNQEDWYNLNFTNFNATIYLSFYKINDNLNEMLEDSRDLAYKHSVKADAIDERIFVHEKNHVFGTLYDIRGNAASPAQFYLTDSTQYFIRGSLYFNVETNRDSLQPVIEFLAEDINHFIESFQWKNIQE